MIEWKHEGKMMHVLHGHIGTIHMSAYVRVLIELQIIWFFFRFFVFFIVIIIIYNWMK